jgi:hypothetical protein
MLAKLQTFSLVGIEALPVEVEVDVSPAALPKTILVGLPEAAVKESTHRVERALVNSVRCFSGKTGTDDRRTVGSTTMGVRPEVRCQATRKMGE